MNDRFLLHCFTCILAVNFMRKKSFETSDPHIRRTPTFRHEIRGKSCGIYALDYGNNYDLYDFDDTVQFGTLSLSTTDLNSTIPLIKQIKLHRRQVFTELLAYMLSGDINENTEVGVSMILLLAERKLQKTLRVSYRMPLVNSGEHSEINALSETQLGYLR